MTSPDRRKLPLGIQTFREIRSGDHYYVDKTAYVRRLLDEGKHYFLSRPGASGRACFWTPARNCSKGTSRCSAVWTSTTAGTGQYATPCCG